MAKPKKITTRKPKLKKKLPIVRICMRAEQNNSIVTMTDLEGRVVAWSSAGKVGFKGTKKSTPFAAQKATEEILEKVATVGASSVHLQVWGHGQGRDAFLRAMQASDVQVATIEDTTGFPFGGPRQKKKRRV